jgi:hypothetical protein
MSQRFAQYPLWLVLAGLEIHMSLWDAFIDDYERRRKDLLKQIELTEARLLDTGKSELESWITTTADSLEQAKMQLAEIQGLLEEAKAKLRSRDQ